MGSFKSPEAQTLGHSGKQCSNYSLELLWQKNKSSFFLEILWALQREKNREEFFRPPQSFGESRIPQVTSILINCQKRNLNLSTKSCHIVLLLFSYIICGLEFDYFMEEPRNQFVLGLHPSRIIVKNSEIYIVF